MARKRERGSQTQGGGRRLLLPSAENCACVFGAPAIRGGRPENCSCVFGTPAIRGGR